MKRRIPSLAVRLLVAQVSVTFAALIGILIALYVDAIHRMDKQLSVFAASLSASIPAAMKEDPQSLGRFAADIARYHATVIAADLGMNEEPRLRYQAFDAAGRPRFDSDLLPPSAATASAVSMDLQKTVDVSTATIAVPIDHTLQTGTAHAVLPAGFNRPIAPFSLVAYESNRAAASLGESSSPSHTTEFRDVGELADRWRTAHMRSADGSVIEVAESLEWRRRAVAQILTPYLRYGILTQLLIVGVGWLIARYTMAPLHGLARLVAMRAPHDLSMLHVQRDYVETLPLTREINRLLGQLQRLLSDERESFSDAAHELLTPIAAVQAQAHLLVTSDANTRDQAAAGLQAGLGRVSALIRQLLLLTRAGSTVARSSFTEGDLSRDLQELVALSAARGIAKGLEISMDAPKSCHCFYDRSLLLPAIDNLIDNAIRYTPPRGKVAITLRMGEKAIFLSVADDGPGIPAVFLDRATERFFRVPGSMEPGSGLGLSIARCVAELHGGTLTLEQGIGARGLAVGISLPAD
jgi:signal transduction histidine kinase